ncbi:MAG TPA: methyltransferase domain-containing protein [Streptosporangiaceae bacterium]|nr:methyltransferase domain-containing protein [Streptosporangiaceae bacterium]
MTAATALRVDPANAGQARAWDGDQGAYWADHAQRFDRAMAAYHGTFMAACGIAAGERVLDIGCGTGQATRDAAAAARPGPVLGVDLSARMLGLARRLAAGQGIGNASFERADAQIYPFPAGSFDVAISRTGTMFFGDPAAAFANIGRALRPGGRLVMLAWQGPEPNEWVRELTGALAAGRDLPAPPPDAPGPFSLADPGRTRTLLASAGFSDVTLDALHGPMWFGSDPDDAHRFVLGLMGWMLDGLDATGRERALDALTATVTAHVGADGVAFASAAWLIRALRATGGTR